MSSSGKVINIGGGGGTSARGSASAVVEDPGLATGAKAKSMPYYVTPPSASAVDTDPDDADDDGNKKKIITSLVHTPQFEPLLRSNIEHFLIFRR